MADDAKDLETTLAELERYRRDRWIVAAALLIAVVSAVAIVFVDEGTWWLAPWAAGAFLLVGGGYGLMVVREERRARDAVRAIVAERERTAGLVARLVAMESLQSAARGVVETDQLDLVFDRLLAAAHELTFARSGVVMLRIGDSLTVAAGDGPDAPERGERFSLTDGVAGAVVRTGQPLLSGRGSPWGTGIYSSSIAAPLNLPDRIVGALVVTRGSEAAPFTEADVAAVALLGQYAALAVRNAMRLDATERELHELRAVNEARASAVTGIMHDLRSPLAAVSGFAQVLQERAARLSPERQEEMLREIRSEASRMRDLIDGLLQAATAEAGRFEPTEVVDLAGIVRDAVRTGRGLAHAQTHPRELRLVAPEAVPVLGDPVALRRIVANLLDNAIAHTPDGTPVEVRLDRAGQQAVLRIRDHGPGLSEEERELAFEPFHHGQGGGSGLGLHVVRTLATAHGGDAVLEPAEGGGLVAVVVLPLAPSNDADPSAPPASGSDGQAPEPPRGEAPPAAAPPAAAAPPPPANPSPAPMEPPADASSHLGRTEPPPPARGTRDGGPPPGPSGPPPRRRLDVTVHEPPAR